MAERNPPPLRALSPAHHGSAYWHPPARYGFARVHQSLPLILAEILPAAACFPILFTADPDGPMPRALLRISPDGQSPFIGPDGRWRAAWLPPVLTTHPFGLITTEAEQPVLGVDETAGLISDDPRGQPLFTPDGTLSPALTGVTEKLRARAMAGPATRQASQALRESGVLTPCPDIEGLSRVDPARAAALHEAQILALHKVGALVLCHAALVSACHLDWLRRAEALIPLTRTTAQSTAPQAHDFLAALGKARDQQRCSQ